MQRVGLRLPMIDLTERGRCEHGIRTRGLHRFEFWRSSHLAPGAVIDITPVEIKQEASALCDGVKGTQCQCNVACASVAVPDGVANAINKLWAKTSSSKNRTPASSCSRIPPLCYLGLGLGSGLGLGLGLGLELGVGVGVEFALRVRRRVKG